MGTRYWQKAFILLLAAGAFGLLLICDFLLLAPAMPSFQAVRAAHQSSEAVLLDRNNEVIHVLRGDPRGRRLAWMGLPDISPVLKKALITAEDRRFSRHRGVDWQALGSAVFGRITGKASRGASTITMQLASQLDRELHPRGLRRSWAQKWRQMKAAMSLERTWTKDEILEAYLNLITFSGELQGIAAASRGIFDKEPSGLDVNESLVLAVLIPSARTAKGRIVRKACAVGSALDVPFSAPAIRDIVEARIGRPYVIRHQIALAPHVARRLLNGGVRRAACTLDKELQARASEILIQGLEALQGRNVHDGALLVVDNATGEILAYAGNTGPSSSARYVDGVLALRQAGSTLKPFLYGFALERRILTASSIVEDAPLKIMAPTGMYQPEDYSGEYLGHVSVRTALASSLNTPAVRTLMVLGVEPFMDRLRALGFTGMREDPGYYGYSLALGTVDISLFDLVQAYTALANNGAFRPLTLKKGSNSPARQGLSPQAAFIVSDILSDRESRSATFGLENHLSTRYWTAVKTGTSKDMRDNWCVGYSRKFTVGVWVGNFSGEPMWNVTGVTGAAPVWMDVMDLLHRSTASNPPTPPQGLVRKETRFLIRERPRMEWYLAGTEPGAPVAPALAHARKAITYPPDGASIALDPDIPGANQAVCFRAEPRARSYQWLLNGKRIGTGAQLLWRPVTGRHTLAIAGPDSTLLDCVRFSVK